MKGYRLTRRGKGALFTTGVLLVLVVFFGGRSLVNHTTAPSNPSLGSQPESLTDEASSHTDPSEAQTGPEQTESTEPKSESTAPTESESQGTTVAEGSSEGSSEESTTLYSTFDLEELRQYHVWMDASDSPESKQGVLSASEKDAIKALAMRYPEEQLVIEGYYAHSNKKALTQRRSNALKGTLSELGIAKNRIHVYNHSLEASTRVDREGWLVYFENHFSGVGYGK